jgi:hypothetical protein
MASHVHMFVSPRPYAGPARQAVERRRAPRYRACVPLQVSGRTNRYTETLDVGRHGMLFPIEGGLQLGSAVAIVVELPDGPMRAMAVPVRNLANAEGAVTATALVLFGTGTELRRRWERFVAGIAGLPGHAALTQKPWEYGLVSARLGGAPLERIEVALDADDLFDPEVQ